MRLRHRILSAVAAAALAGAGLVGTAAPSQAAACSSTNGVTVVVQGPSGTQVRCASGDPGSAWGALQTAGFSLTAVQRFPDALCRVDGAPASDPCINMPPANAYWSFWHAPNGGSWTYSQIGIKGWNPKPGSSVGFRFGSGTAPSTAPATVSAPKPTTAAPKPTTAAPTPRSSTTAPSTPRSTTQAPSGRTTAPSATSGTTGTTRAPGATPGTTPTPAAVSPSVSPTPSSSASATTSATGEPSASASGSSSDAVAAGPTDGGSSSNGSGGSGTARLLGGGALLAGLGSAVAFVGLRRRQAQTSV